MALSQDIKILDVSIPLDDVYTKTLQLIISELRPDWHQDNIIKEDTSGGVNSVCCYHLDSDADRADAIIVRVYGGKAESSVFLHDNELLTMQVAHHVGVFPAVLAFFMNGVAYQYAVGTIVRPHQLHEPSVYSCVAHTLADFHTADLRAVPLVDRHGHSTHYPLEQKFVARYYGLISAMECDLPDDKLEARYAADCIPLSQMRCEMEYITGVLDNLDLEVGLCHMDYHHLNMVYNQKENMIQAIDFEFAACEYLILDIANLFEAYRYRNCLAWFEGEETEMTEIEQREWIRCYLTRRMMHRGLPPALLHDNHIQLILTECRLVELLLHIAWVVLGRFGLSSNLAVPFEVAPIAKAQYYSKKGSVDALVAEHRQLTEKVGAIWRR